jgi:hypothetical protein
MAASDYVPIFCKSRRLFVAAGDQSNGLPTIKVAYIVLGDTLDICMVTVEE